VTAVSTSSGQMIAQYRIWLPTKLVMSPPGGTVVAARWTSRDTAGGGGGEVAIGTTGSAAAAVSPRTATPLLMTWRRWSARFIGPPRSTVCRGHERRARSVHCGCVFKYSSTGICVVDAYPTGRMTSPAVEL